MNTAALIPLGWSTLQAQALAGIAAGLRPVRLVEQHRSGFRVDDGTREFDARPLPPLLKRLQREDDGLVVGDWALCRDDGGWLAERLPRSSLLEREREEAERQRLAANVDTALLVMGLDGDYRPERLARYRLLALAAGVQPVIVLSKPDKSATVDALRGEIETLAGDTPVRVLDPRQPGSVDALAPWLRPGQTLVLLGSSGVGKSTLTNTLLGREAQRTGATQALDDLGRHTTTARRLHRLPGGACLIDTPGLRELKLSRAQSRVEDKFEDVQALATQCRFRDCQHRREPGCAVTAALPAARIEAWRESLQPVAAKGPQRRR